MPTGNRRPQKPTVLGRQGGWRRPPVRYKVRFTEKGALDAAVAAEVPGIGTDFPVVNRKRGYVSIEVPGTGKPQLAPQLRYLRRQENQTIRLFERGINLLQYDFHVELQPETQYEPELTDEPEWWPFSPQDRRKLPEVLDAINATPIASLATQGDGAVVAVVDTGVNPRKAGIGAPRQGVGFSVGDSGNPWQDPANHGTRSALIAAGDAGLAPAATVYPCRTQFYEGELTAIFDHLIDDLLPSLGDRRLVITNSYGFRSASPPMIDTDLSAAIDEAVAADVVVVFSAGNYHKLAGGGPNTCSPTTIWSYKCSAQVLTVAAAGLNDRMQAYSSRGPGQLAGQPGTSPKPDVTAPVPRRWATSGACPQVAGLAALLFTGPNGMDASGVRAAIVNTARPMGYGHDCEGAGLIDCRGALAQA